MALFHFRRLGMPYGLRKRKALQVLPPAEVLTVQLPHCLEVGCRDCIHYRLRCLVAGCHRANAVQSSQANQRAAVT